MSTSAGSSGVELSVMGYGLCLIHNALVRSHNKRGEWWGDPLLPSWHLLHRDFRGVAL